MSKTVIWSAGECAFPMIQEWTRGDDALIQCVENPNEGCELTTFMSGAQAYAAIENDLAMNGAQIAELVLDDDGYVFGYVWDDGQVTEYWDCCPEELFGESEYAN